MIAKYISIIILLALIGVSSFKVHEHKDDECKKKLAVYASITAASSIMLLHFAYALYAYMSPKDKVIDAILNDFLKLD